MSFRNRHPSGHAPATTSVCDASRVCHENAGKSAAGLWSDDVIMLFMLVSRAKPGTQREQLVERLTRELHPETWDLIRRGELSHILYKVGDEPGFFALLNAPSFEAAKSLVA